MKYYAIRHKPTGFFLPSRVYPRGYTFDEPTDPNECFPRVFYSKLSAKKALAAWLQGKWVAKYGAIYGSSGIDYECDEYQYIDIIPVESRKADEMEIVVLGIYVLTLGL